MPVYQWKPIVEKQAIYDPFGGEVGKAVNRLQEKGFVKFFIHKERGRTIDSSYWSLEATKFVREEA